MGAAGLIAMAAFFAGMAGRGFLECNIKED
jgi:hypothetical protein